MKLAIATALVAVAQAGSVPYTNCGTKADILSDVQVTASPYPPTKGATVAIDITGTLSEAVASGTYELGVSVDGIKVISKSGSICKLTTCPINKGPIKFSKSESLPSSIPDGTYTVSISGTADGSTPLFCADLKLTIGGDEETDMIEAQKDMEFASFVETYAREYLVGTAEYEERRKVFGTNFDYIKQQNARYEAGELTHFLAVNEFADLTAAEFAVRRGYKVGASRRTNEVAPEPTQAEMVNAPASVDWTTKGVVTPVKNQGQCGSCWSFSTTGSIESRSAIKTGKLISLSEQQLMDCSTSYGNQGCNGGEMDDAFQYVVATGGLSTETCDSYTAADGTCHWKGDGCKLNDPISSYTDVQHNCEKCLVAAVAEGPVSIAVDASGSDWQFYSGGVLGADGSCGQQLDHGVLAVGYGSSGGKDFWKVKNSWGASWGNGGYLQIARGVSPSACGILNDPSFPVV